MTARQEELPAASCARTVTTLVPVSRGTTADQLVVPAAVPESPFEVDQVTLLTPTLSLAEPLSVMVLE